MPEPQGARIPASRVHPPHAAKAMSNQQMIPDGLLGQLRLNLTQDGDDLLGAKLPTSGYPGLLWSKLILSISPAQNEPVRSGRVRTYDQPVIPTALTSDACGRSG